MVTLNEALEICGRKSNTRIDWSEVVRLWFQIDKQSEVAKQLGIGQSHVSRILLACGISVGKGKRSAIHKLPMDDIRVLYEAGWSTTELGRKFDVDAEVIRRRMHRAGIARRKRGQYERHGPENQQWKQGGDKHGREYGKLARVVAVLCLQKRLPAGAVIHHMNENRSDNDPKNLWMFPSAADHLRYHQRLLESRKKAGSAFANLMAKGNGGVQLPQRYDLIGSLLDTSLLDPYRTRVRIENVLKASGLMSGRPVQLRGRHRQ